MTATLTDYAARIERLAQDLGLDYYPVDFELVPDNFMMEIAVYGLPVRMPHWSFGVRYIHQLIRRGMGHSRIFEVMFPGDPCHAYLVDGNTLPENVLVTAGFEMLFGGLSLLAAGLLRGELASLTFNVRTASALAYLIVFGAIAGFTAYAYALKHLPIATVSLYAYVNPVIAVALGTLVLKEPFNARLGTASAIVLAGMALVRDLEPERLNAPGEVKSRGGSRAAPTRSP